MSIIDWAILIAFMVFLTTMAITARKYTRSVADFLAANRCAGKYILAVGEGMSGMGAITVIAVFQQTYEAGFTQIWWNSTILALVVLVAITGWVVYRFRQTRALTLGQFFEIRYSRRFRIFSGVLIFVSGVLNFGIFPAVGARFAQYYCGLPLTIPIAGFEVDSYPVIMAILIGVSYAFTFFGGQIAVVITDFTQGVFANVVFVVVVIVVFWKFDWDQISTSLMSTPEDKSAFHPFKIGGLENYDTFYWLVIIFSVFYATMGWQGSQAYNSSARTPHEARMAKILGHLRTTIPWVFMAMVPICAFTMFNHPDFAQEAASANEVLLTIDSDQIRKQMRVPVALSTMLPVGLLGLLCAVMLAALISTHDTYMHSWGCIFLQDIVLPLRKKPFTPAQHIRYLRWSIFAVCVFIFFFSYHFEQNTDIFMFMALTGAIFLGGSGAVLIGGLYWKRGTTAGAWAAMLTCMFMSIVSFVVQHQWEAMASWLQNSTPGFWEMLTGILPKLTSEKFIFTPQEMYFFNMMASSLSYIGFSLLTCRKAFDMDRILHRGAHALESDQTPEEISGVPNWKRVFGIQGNLSLDDKAIVIFSYSFVFVLLAVSIFGTIYHFTVGASDASWLLYWRIWIWVFLSLTIILTLWLGIGGLLDLRTMLRILKTLKRDHRDAGMVEHHEDSSDA